MKKTVSPFTIRLICLGLTICAVGLVFQAFIPVYLSKANFFSILRAMSINGIVAIGLSFVIVVRKFDLSLAGVASLSAMTLGFVLSNTNSLAATIASAIIVGLIFGMISGYLVGRFALPDVVTTIAVGSIAYGTAFIYNGGATFSDNFFSSGMVTMNYKTILGIQIPVFLLFVCILVFAYLLHTTRIGQALYATGENPRAAQFSGISTTRMMVLAFGICGGLVGLAMVLQISGIGSSRVTAGGQILLPAYTSVYLGAALLGRVSILATMAGVLLTTMLLNAFTLLSVPYYYSDAVISLMLISAITIFDPKVLAQLSRATQVFKKQGRV